MKGRGLPGGPVEDLEAEQRRTMGGMGPAALSCVRRRESLMEACLLNKSCLGCALTRQLTGGCDGREKPLIKERQEARHKELLFKGKRRGLIRWTPSSALPSQQPSAGVGLSSRCLWKQDQNMDI